MPNCEFCDMSLQSQLDVSKHLVSQIHRDNVKKHRDTHPSNKSSLKDTPSNIIKVFESLRLRSPNDVRNLADKTYFRIRSQDKEKSAAFLGVADELVNVLLECIVDYRTRYCNPENKKKIKDSICRVKEEPKERIHKPREEERTTKSPTAINSNTATYRPQSSIQPDGESNTPSRSPPLKRRPPLIDSTPIPVRPSLPIGTQVSSPDSSRVTGNVGTASRMASLNDSRGPVRVNNPRSNPANPPRPRTTGLIPSSRPVAPRAPTNTITQDRFPNRQASTASRNPEFQTTMPASQPIREQRPPRPQPFQHPRPSAPQINRHPRPQASRAPMPPRDILPPEQMPMAGASFMPYNPMQHESPPQPRLESSYRPRLAKIKVEPKDNT